jgi:predicted TIM-barrel fold metal-dependent hydrolase
MTVAFTENTEGMEMAEKNKFKLISADSHILEPADIFEKYLPAEFRASAPVLKDYKGGSAWFVADDIEPVALPRTAKTGSGYREGTPLSTDAPIAYSDVLLSLYDPAERLKAQYSDSIDAEVLYPTPGLWDAVKMLDDNALKLALVKAYNNWIADFCAYAPDRLIGLGIVPTTSVEDARDEAERVASELGLRGMVLGAFPSGAPVGGNPDDDPFWEVVDRTGLVISIHVAIGNEHSTMPFGGIGGGEKPQMADAIQPMVSSGFFDRFENVRIVLAHGDAGWAIHWLEFGDMYFLRHRHLSNYSLKHEDRLLSDYIRRRVWFTFHNDSTAVKNRHNIGAAHLLWASHFPYDDSNWPDNRQQATRVTSVAPDDVRDALVAGNVARLYRLPGYEQGFDEAAITEFVPLVHY